MKQSIKIKTMKLHLTILLLFTGIFAQAKYTTATVYYLDGKSEKGLINSFLEDRFFDFNFFGTFEQGLIYNDKSITFKLNEEAEASKVPIADIDKIILHYENFDKEYKALFIRNIDRKGVLEEPKARIFLPLLRSGKINIYGFYHRDVSTSYSDPKFQRSTVTVTELFYYQNANENYAIDYFNIELQDVFNLRDRMANPLRELFKDCEELVAKVDNVMYEKNLSKEEKKRLREESKASFKAMQRAYNSIPADQKRGDLLLYHDHYLKTFNDLLQEYENCN